MTVAPTTYGDNPQQPAVYADVYTPDQLIAGPTVAINSQSVTLTGGAALKRGTVLGRVNVGAAGTPAAAAGNTGNGTVSAVSLGTEAKVGTYAVLFTGATTFDVIDPNGVRLESGRAAGVYPAATPAGVPEPEIGFTFTAGATPMVAGDAILIPVAAGAGKYKIATAAAVDGSNVPCAILADDADPSGGDVLAGIYLSGQFNSRAVLIDASLTLGNVQTALQAVGIFLKSSVSAADPT